MIATDGDLVRVSRDNPGYRFEREEDGTIVASPTNTKGGVKSLEAAGQLRDYKKRVGGKAFDSSTGAESDGFWPLSPDVVIEVKSGSDIFGETIAKIEMFVERGTNYAVAIDPSTREVVQRGTPPPELLLDFDAISDA
jgi:Uma2 family endonuclease